MLHIYQVVAKSHGTRSSPLVQTPQEMVDSFKKVFGDELQNHYVLILSSIPEGEDESVLNGISRFPLITLSRFVHMNENPDEALNDFQSLNVHPEVDVTNVISG
jgi:hypothetical protein